VLDNASGAKERGSPHLRAEERGEEKKVARKERDASHCPFNAWKGSPQPAHQKRGKKTNGKSQPIVAYEGLGGGGLLSSKNQGSGEKDWKSWSVTKREKENFSHIYWREKAGEADGELPKGKNFGGFLS